MDETIKAKWVSALRSGEYNQTRRTLRDDVGFCCLGVLCDVTSKASWEEDNQWRFDDELSDNELPTAFRKRIGMSGGDESHLVVMNDDKGASFSEIADYIEVYL